MKNLLSSVKGSRTQPQVLEAEVTVAGSSNTNNNNNRQSDTALADLGFAGILPTNTTDYNVRGSTGSNDNHRRFRKTTSTDSAANHRGGSADQQQQQMEALNNNSMDNIVSQETTPNESNSNNRNWTATNGSTFVAPLRTRKSTTVQGTLPRMEHVSRQEPGQISTRFNSSDSSFNASGSSFNFEGNGSNSSFGDSFSGLGTTTRASIRIPMPTVDKLRSSSAGGGVRKTLSSSTTTSSSGSPPPPRGRLMSALPEDRQFAPQQQRQAHHTTTKERSISPQRPVRQSRQRRVGMIEPSSKARPSATGGGVSSLSLVDPKRIIPAGDLKPASIISGVGNPTHNNSSGMPHLPSLDRTASRARAKMTTPFMSTTTGAPILEPHSHLPKATTQPIPSSCSPTHPYVPSPPQPWAAGGVKSSAPLLDTDDDEDNDDYDDDNVGPTPAQAAQLVMQTPTRQLPPQHHHLHNANLVPRITEPSYVPPSPRRSGTSIPGEIYAPTKPLEPAVSAMTQSTLCSNASGASVGSSQGSRRSYGRRGLRGSRRQEGPPQAMPMSPEEEADMARLLQLQADLEQKDIKIAVGLSSKEDVDADPSARVVSSVNAEEEIARVLELSRQEEERRRQQQSQQGGAEDEDEMLRMVMELSRQEQPVAPATPDIPEYDSDLQMAMRLSSQEGASVSTPVASGHHHQQQHHHYEAQSFSPQAPPAWESPQQQQNPYSRPAAAIVGDDDIEDELELEAIEMALKLSMQQG